LVAAYFTPASTGQPPWCEPGSKRPSGRMLQNSTASPLRALTAKPFCAHALYVGSSSCARGALTRGKIVSPPASGVDRYIRTVAMRLPPFSSLSGWVK
jgi:hypothetical protein